MSDIEAENLTHLMYAFYDTIFDEATDTTTIESLDDYADTLHAEDPGLYYDEGTLRGNMRALKLLKERNPHLQILISLGGWTKLRLFWKYWL